MLVVRLLVWTSLLAGCLKPDLQPCGDLLCAADSVCLPSGQCATQESIDACAGHVDGQVCMTSVFTGSCVMGVCTAPRCGDAVISGSEQCDGPVSGVDCVDYGFDTGVPTCSALCGLDVVGSCVRFGWNRLYADATAAAWTNGTLSAVILEDRQHIKLFNGTALLQEAAFPGPDASWLAGNGTTIVAGGYGRVMRSENGGPFTDIDVSALPGGDMVVQVANDGTIYVGELSNDTNVFFWTGSSWQQILSTVSPSSGIQWVDGHLYLFYDNGDLDRYTPGTGWSRVTSAPGRVQYVSVRPSGGLYISTIGFGPFELVGTTLVPFLDGDYSQLVPLHGELFAGGNDNTLVRRDGNAYELIDCPIFGNLISDGTDIYIYGNGVYRFTGTQFAARNGVGETGRDVKLLASGETALITTSQVLVTVSYDTWNYTSPTELPTAAAGRASNDFYVAEDGLFEHWNGTAYAAVATPAGIPAINDILWDDATSTLYAVGASGLAMKRVGTTWTMLPALTGCDLFEMAMQGGQIYAVGTCGTEGVVWKLAGSTWIEQHRSSFALVAISVDGTGNVYAAGLDGGVLGIGGTWHDEPRARGISISATSPTDIWVGGGPEDLFHYDGTLWSRVRLVGAAAPHVLATPHAVYIAGASTSVLVR